MIQRIPESCSCTASSLPDIPCAAWLPRISLRAATVNQGSIIGYENVPALGGALNQLKALVDELLPGKFIIDYKGQAQEYRNAGTMTGIATAAGSLPLLLSSGTGADSGQVIGTVILAGALASTVCDAGGLCKAGPMRLFAR